MSTLFTYGCSYTADYRLDKGNYELYYNFRGGNFPDVWPKILSKKLNFELKNYGSGGVGNDFIFNKLCKNIREIKKGDIVIIGWSYINRYKWADFKSNLWMMANISEPIVSETNNKIIHDEISYNRTHPLYIEEIFDYMNIIDYFSEIIGFDVYYWSNDSSIIYQIPMPERQDKKFLISNLVTENNQIPFNEVLKFGGQRIFDETNGLINDNHFGEMGHKIIAELFYEHIKNYKLI